MRRMSRSRSGTRMCGCGPLPKRSHYPPRHRKNRDFRLKSLWIHWYHWCWAGPLGHPCFIGLPGFFSGQLVKHPNNNIDQKWCFLFAIFLDEIVPGRIVRKYDRKFVGFYCSFSKNPRVDPPMEGWMNLFFLQGCFLGPQIRPPLTGQDCDFQHEASLA